MIRSQLNSYSGSDPIWGFVALVGSERFSGEAAVGLDPRIRLFAVDGRVYFAEREGDAPIGALLVDSGVLSAAQLEQGSVRVGDTSSLARLFQRDPSVDRDAVELTIESATETLLASIANKPVGMPEVFPLRHHSSGVHHWLRGTTVAAAPPTLPDDVVVDDVVVESVVVESVVMDASPVEEIVVDEPAVEEAVAAAVVAEDQPVVEEEPVVEEARVIEEEPAAAEMPTIEMPVTEEPVIEPLVAEPAVGQSPWHATVPLVVDSEPQVNGFAHAHSEPIVDDAIHEHVVEDDVEPTAPALLSSLLWLTPAAADAAVSDAAEVVAEEPPTIEPETAESEPATPEPASALLTLPSFSSLRAPDTTPTAVVQEPAIEESVVEAPVIAEAPVEVPTMPTLSSFTTLAAPVPAEPTPVLTTDFFGALSDPTVDSPDDQKLPGLPPLNAFEPAELPAELPKLAAAPMSMDELVSQNTQSSAEAQSWSGATHNLAAVDIWEMVDEIVDDGHQTDEQLVGTGCAEKRSRGWLRGRKS
ncbi:MAG: hypothetical protein Q8M22_14225 [Actinomycetota bacterium]|nr:hypothetical protein [Actinomycetota bacterium]